MVSIYNIYYYEESNSLADEIGEALQRVASAAANSNLSLEKTSSWLATISSVSREGASTIGRSLNSIIARFESIKEKGFNEEDATQINDVTKALSSIGISPTVNGQLRDLSEIMDEVGGKWETLSKNEKSYIATTMAGTYQRNRFITLMNNYDDSLKNYENAMNSAGTAAKKFEIYQDSAQAHVDSFKVSLENLWQTSFNSETFKNLIDSASGLIDVLNELVNNPMTKFIVIAASGALVGKGLAAMFAKLAASALANMIAVTKMSYSLVGLSSTIEILTGVMMASPLFWGAVAAGSIYLIVKAFDAMTVTLKEQKEIVAELSAEVNSLKSEYDKLSGKNFLTTAEREKLEILKEQLKTKKKLLALEKKEENKKYVDEYTSEPVSRASLYGDTSGTTADSKLDKNNAKIKNYKDSVKDLTKTLADFKKETDSKKKDELGAEYDRLTLSVEKSKSKLLDLYNSMTSRKNSGAVFTKEMNTQYKELGDVLGLSAQKAKSAKTVMSDLASSEKYLADVAKDMNKNHGISKKRMQELVDLYPELAGYVVETSDGFYIESDAIDTANLSSKKFALAQINDQITQTKQTIKSTKERINAFIEEANVYAQTQAIKNGLYSNKSADLAVGKSTNLGGNSYLDMMLGKTTIPDASSLTVKKSAKQEKAEKELKAQQDKLKDLQKIADGLNKDIADFSKDVSKADPIPASTGDDSKDKAEETAIAWQDATQAIVDTINQQVKLDNLTESSLERQLKAAEYAKDYTKQIEIQNQLLGNQKKTVLDLEEANAKIHEHADAIRKSTTYDTSSWFNVDNTDSEAYLALLNSFAGKTDDASKATVEYIQDIHDQLRTLKEGWTDNKNSIDDMNISILSTTDAIKELNLEILNNQKDVLSEQKDNLQTIIDLTEELIKKEKEDEKEAIQNNIDRYKNLIALKKEALDIAEKEKSYQDEVNDKTKDISKLQEQADTLGLDTSREAQSQRADLLQQIQDKQEELNQYQHDDAVEKQQSALDKQLTAFEKEKDAESKEIDDYLKKTGQLTRDAMRRIDAEGQSLYNDLITYNSEYGSKLESEIVSAWASATKALEDYGSTLNAVSNIQSEITSIESASKKKTTNNTSTDSKDNIKDQMQANSKAWFSANESERIRLASENQKLGASIRAVYSDGTWYTDSTKKVLLYHNGLEAGFVGGSETIVSPKQNELLALLKKGELIINPEQQLNLSDNLTSFQNLASSSINNNSGSISLTITAPVTITGSADSSTITQLNKFGDMIADKALDKLNTQFNNRGMFKNVAFNALKG